MLTLGAVAGLCEFCSIVDTYVLDRNVQFRPPWRHQKLARRCEYLFTSGGRLSHLEGSLDNLATEQVRIRGRNTPYRSKTICTFVSGIAIIVPIAIPTIAAFSFAAWFNPWYL